MKTSLMPPALLVVSADRARRPVLHRRSPGITERNNCSEQQHATHGNFLRLLSGDLHLVIASGAKQ